MNLIDLLEEDGVIKPPLSLAPMVGLSHAGLRSLVADFGGCGLFFTEMLSAKRLPHENPAISAYLHRTKQDKPLVYQLFIAEESYVPAAVAKIEKLGGDGVDINLGCPAPNVRRGGAGAALSDDWLRVQEIVAACRRGTDKLVSAKIRLGHQGKEDQLYDFCRMLEGEGVDLITVHARYHGEKFCRRPRWQMLENVCHKLQIPVWANGGIFSVEDAKLCLERSGANGLMLGRGAVERPWLFRDIAREVYGFSLPELKVNLPQIYFKYLDKMESIFAPERQLGRVKQFTHYLAKNHQFGHHLASAVQRSNSVDEAIEKAEAFFGVLRNDHATTEGENDA